MPTSRAKMPIRLPINPIRLSSDRAPDGHAGTDRVGLVGADRALRGQGAGRETTRPVAEVGGYADG
jgi:hypothetical protein